MEKTPLDHDEERRPRPAERTPDRRDSDPEGLYWRQFAEAKTPNAFSRSWLPLQCAELKGVRSAMVLLGRPDVGPFSPVAVWPDAKMSMNHLTGVAERALKERRGLLMEAEDAGTGNTPETFHVAYPVEVSEKIHGVVVLEVEQRTREDIQSVMRKLHWGAAWLEVLIRRTESLKSAEVNERLQNVLDLMASAVEHKSFQESAMALVTRLATTLDCDRVSLGFIKGRHVKVDTLSHTAEFGKDTNLVRAIGSAMDEAVDQHSTVVYPQPEKGASLVIRAHEDLFRQHGAGAVLTIPLENKGNVFGAILLERPKERPFDEPTVELCETAAALAGPILEIKRLEDRWLIQKAGDSFETQLMRLLGRGYLLRKLIVILILALVAFFYTFEVDYRVTAPTSIEGAVQRVVAAPFDGYIMEAPVRAGDLVRKGDLLCHMDDRDLKLERLRWSTEKEQLIKQYHEAMAKHERSQLRIVRTKIDQADAQIALLDEQLSRTRVVSPFNGLVMSGDLSQSLGAPVERGDILFEVAPLDEYRVIAEVDERDIRQIREGYMSELVLPSMPDEEFPFIVEKITPVSTAKEGRNSFRVEGKMEGAPQRLRPGMEGIGKITIRREKLIWVWTHEAIDWIRLQIWKWRP